MKENISNITEGFINNYFENDYRLSKSALNLKGEKQMFNSIHKSMIYYNNHKGEINKSITHNSFIKNKEILDGSYVADDCRSYIVSNTKIVLKYSMNILGTRINIFITLFDDEDVDNYNVYKKKIKYIVVLLHFLLSKKNIVKKLDIYLCLAPINKTLPENPIDVLDKSNCNSGLSMLIGTGESILLVYRLEEWFKVLIHELIHCLHLDISFLSYQFLKKKLREMYPIKSLFNVNETFTELLANVLNISICSYLAMEKNDFDVYILYKKTFLMMERYFSLVQLNKILGFMNLSYEQLYEKDKMSDVSRLLYKERTHVFSYYILKCVLLYHYNEFVLWCLKNDVSMVSHKNTKLLYAFSKFLELHYNSSRFLKDIEWVKKNHKKENNGLRMTIVEMKF
tara:strand:- start:7586 stop:8776 length:1191 start_codon:yes stop_codon:yes gene_type:complete